MKKIKQVWDIFFGLPNPDDVVARELREAQLELLEARNEVEKGRIHMESYLVQCEVLQSRIARLEEVCGQ